MWHMCSHAVLQLKYRSLWVQAVVYSRLGPLDMFYSYDDSSVTPKLLAVNSCCCRSNIAQAHLDINMSEADQGAIMDQCQLLTVRWSGEVVDYRYVDEATEQVI